jgi:hypothetical protein
MSPAAPREAATLFWAVFWGTVVVLALLWGYAHVKLERLAVDEQGRVLVSESYLAEWKAALPGVFSDMEDELLDARSDIEAIISESIDAAFEPVYGQIPAFLDFHYSLLGEYTELAAAFENKVGADVERILFRAVGFDQRLDDGIGTAVSEADAVLRGALERLNRRIGERLQLKSSDMAVLAKVAILSIEDAKSRFGGTEMTAKGTGAAVGAATVATLIGKKVAAKLAAKAVAKGAAKAAGFGTGAASGATAGLICGPAAWICAPVAAVVAGTTLWLVTDKIVIEVDQYLNRDEFATAIRTEIDQERIRIAEHLTHLYRQRLEEILEQNKASLEGITTRQIIEQGAR